MQAYPRPSRPQCKVLLSGGVLLLGLALTTLAGAAAPAFTLFESGQVRPLAMSPDGRGSCSPSTRPITASRSSASTGTGSSAPPPSRWASSRSPSRRGRTTRSGWSTTSRTASASSSSTTTRTTGRVERTLLVGDEPRDIVFAGPRRSRAFITTAHRGQNVPFDPQLTTPGVGRADVWVFDASALGSTLGGTPLTIVDPVHGHAARARGDARRHPRLRRGLPHRQPDHRRPRDR